MTLGQRVDQALKGWENPSWWRLYVALPWTLGVILGVYQWNVNRHIASREQTTQGIITAHEPENHNRFGYSFTVAGRRFTGWDSPVDDGLEIGRSVLVYYDPANPDTNALTEFGERGLSSLGPAPLLLFGVGTISWLITTRRRKLRRDSKCARANSR